MENRMLTPHTLLISEIEIMPVMPQDGLVAFASCVVNAQIYLGNIGIHTRPDGNGYRLVFPIKVLPNGKQINCFHPVTRSAGDVLHAAIIKQFETLVETARRSEKVDTKEKQSGGQSGKQNDDSEKQNPYTVTK